MKKSFFIILIFCFFSEKSFSQINEISSDKTKKQNLIDKKNKTYSEKNNKNLSSYDKSIIKSCNCYENIFTLEFKPSYFYFQDKTFRKIFNDEAFLAIFGFDAKFYKYLHTWLDIGYLHDTGFVIEAEDAKTSIFFIPVSIGLKYQLKVNSNVSLYAKIAPNWFYVKEIIKNYPFINSKVTKNGFGYTTGIGSFINISKCFALDFFIDYLYSRKKFNDANSRLSLKVYSGGLAFGAGIGYKF
jgi:hypothetical protein